MKNEHLTPRETPIQAGETAPDFTLLDQHRNEFTLSEALKEGDVALSFFPMAFTEVCESEMNCVHKEWDSLTRSGTRFVGVSCDSFAALKAWSDQAGYRQPLLADMHRAVCKAYGLYWADLNLASRGTVIVAGGDSADAGKVKWAQAREVMQAFDLGEVQGAL